MAMMTNLPTTLNLPERDGLNPGYPKLSPTVPYAETTSKRTENTVNACETGKYKQDTA